MIFQEAKATIDQDQFPQALFQVGLNKDQLHRTRPGTDQDQLPQTHIIQEVKIDQDQLPQPQ